MGNTSFSRELDPQLLNEIAAELAVDVSFIEKDWHAVAVLKIIAELPQNTFKPVFSGGTSLSKGYGLIQRFSEDIDFKVISLTNFSSQAKFKRNCKGYRDQIVEAIGNAGWSINADAIRTLNEFKFFSIPVRYNSRFDQSAALRPHLKVELSIKEPMLLTSERPVRSLVAKYSNSPPEVTMIAYVDPVETTADKLSILTRKVLSRNRGSERDDPTLIRHLHDLAALEETALQNPAFAPLARKTLEEDKGRGKPSTEIFELPLKKRLLRTASSLKEDDEYRSEYDRFVRAVSYASADEQIDFDFALEAFDRICNAVSA